MISATLFNGLAQIGVEAYWQFIVKGLILVLAVAASGVLLKRRTR
jgi:ABC-type glucose/galactose transport system permease subunit